MVAAREILRSEVDETHLEFKLEMLEVFIEARLGEIQRSLEIVQASNTQNSINSYTQRLDSIHNELTKLSVWAIQSASWAVLMHGQVNSLRAESDYTYSRVVGIQLVLGTIFILTITIWVYQIIYNHLV